MSVRSASPLGCWLRWRQGDTGTPGLVLLLAFLGLCLVVGRARSQVVDQDLWVTSGTVASTARSGNTLYVAGSLGEIGPATGGGVPIDAATGATLPRYPKVTGYVGAAVADGAGGWFIGGDFTAVGGEPRSSLAHVLADGSVGPWAPTQDGHNIACMALSGGTLYVAGDFNIMDGQSRIRIAAFDAITGELTSWDPHTSGTLTPDGGPEIDALAVSGDTVFVGGGFTETGGQPRVALAALDATSASALDWYPGAPNSFVNALAIHGSTLYMGGTFTGIGGQTRNLIAAVDASTGALLPWAPVVKGRTSPYVTGPYVDDLLVRDSTVYVAGRFDSIGDQPRSALAAVSATTGSVRPWRPDPIYHYSFPWPYVRCLASWGDTIYVGGSFDAIGGQEHAYLAAVDATTGLATNWSPRPNEQVWSLAVSGAEVYAGGTFRTMGPWVQRSCLAALDLTTGAARPWNPDPNGLVVNSVLAAGGTVYAGGDFTFIGGQPRSGIAALDTLSGAATSWNPAADGSVEAMVLSDSTLYVGGGFGNIGGQARRYAAALDTATGLARGWNPDASDWVFAVARDGDTVYLGGLFEWMGGEPHKYMAAVDATSGAVRPWQADADWVVDALATSGGSVYAGGEFSVVNGQARQCLAALDATTGALRPWDPHVVGWGVASATPIVHALATHGHTVYAGGDFYTIGGQTRPCLVGLDDSLGVATEWAPRADNPVWSVAISGNTLYAGGSFGSIGLLPNSGLAALSIPEDPAPRPPAFALRQNIPNPARSETVIRFTLPTSAAATLSIYDIQGRRLARPLDCALVEPGPHEVPLELRAWRPGVYLYRLEAGGREATRKMLVVR